MITESRKSYRADRSADATATDPGILQRYSTLQSYDVPSTGFTYLQIRTFYRPHPQADKLPSKPLPLPLIVCIHGLGGSVAQFSPLLTSLVCAPCLSIDLPGCGRSDFAPRDWDAYTIESLVQLLYTVIEAHRDVANNQGVILIGHSMGCSIAALLASKASKDVGDLPNHVIGFIGICPRFTPLTKSQATTARRLLSIPTPIFALWRAWDKRGGANSPSVRRFVGAGADDATKKMQLRFNSQSKTDVWRRMAYGLLPHKTKNGSKGGLPGSEVWAGIDIPVYLISGKADTVTSPEELQKLIQVLKTADPEHGTYNLDPALSENSSPSMKATMLPTTRIIRSHILPSPASHALLFAPSTHRTLAGLIETFLADHVDHRLSLGWQLQYLSTEGKWDVKNLEKWQAVTPVSEPIASVFRAMKTMREVDDVHCPEVFVKRWKGDIYAVLDISHEAPVYDPAGLEKGGIKYFKFPTVSKLPPTVDEVKAFNDLVDSIRESIAEDKLDGHGSLIAVHCHYGFNRTGFQIICYLVERLGWELEAAIEEFARRRPPGVRHEYFIDTLYVRYCAGMRKGSTA